MPATRKPNTAPGKAPETYADWDPEKVYAKGDPPFTTVGCAWPQNP